MRLIKLRSTKLEVGFNRWLCLSVCPSVRPSVRLSVCLSPLASRANVRLVRRLPSQSTNVKN